MASMRDKQQDEPNPSRRPESSEYGDALTDVLKDQERRNELRKAAPSGSGRSRMHPVVPPVLALISVWLWAFPPAALQPVQPSIPPANQEAGLRMEMFIQVGKIQAYLEENGSIPGALGDLDEATGGLVYTPLGQNVFRLSGRSGDIEVDFTSTESIEELLGNAQAIVSGLAPPTPAGGPAR